MTPTELLGDQWGELCVTPERASRRVDEFIDAVRVAWSPDPELRGSREKPELTAALSASSLLLLKALSDSISIV